VPALLTRANGKAMLAAGERDPMCRPDQLRAADPHAVVLPGAGHNVHVENPMTLWPVLDRLLASATDAIGR
jgi:pimeloyl-ACP methyl ester carboxylesterase